ncbi:hypothetical protein D3C72_1412080 [compost metagenome]
MDRDHEPSAVEDGSVVMGSMQQIEVCALGFLGDLPVLQGVEDRHLAKAALQIRIR